MPGWLLPLSCSLASAASQLHLVVPVSSPGPSAPITLKYRLTTRLTAGQEPLRAPSSLSHPESIRPRRCFNPQPVLPRRPAQHHRPELPPAPHSRGILPTAWVWLFHKGLRVSGTCSYSFGLMCLQGFVAPPFLSASRRSPCVTAILAALCPSSCTAILTDLSPSQRVTGMITHSYAADFQRFLFFKRKYNLFARSAL